MADADIPITAGSGTKVDTRTVGAGTDEHRQVVVVGDPTTAANVATVTAAGAQKVDASGVAVPVTDNAGSLTTDTPQLPAALVSGRLDVNIGGASATPTVANVEALVDNGGFTDGTSKVFPTGLIFDETAGTGLTENDVGAARMDSKRAAISVLEDATTRGRRAIVSATGGLLGDQGAPAAQANAWFVRPRKLATYKAMFKATARPYTLSNVFGAAGRKQFATIHHAAAATKTVLLRRVQVLITGSTAAVDVQVELVRITAAPATGNPTTVASKADSSSAAVEATTLALPTTAGTEEAQPFSSAHVSPGITGASTTANPVPWQDWRDLYVSSPGADEGTMPTIRAGVLEGWAVTLDASAAVTIFGQVLIEFTEE